MFDQTHPSQTSPSANTSDGASRERPGSERSPSETYRAVGAALLAWGVAVGAWGLFQLPGEAGTVELPNGSSTPGSSHAFTTNIEAATFENFEARLDAMTGLVSELAGLNPAILPELADISGL